MSLHPAIASVRRGVRTALTDLEPGDVVMVACSGGADSLALLSATVFEGHKAGLRVIGATVDHGMQDESAKHAAHVVDQMAEVGADQTANVRVNVEDDAGVGPEAAARQARYAVLAEIAERYDAVRVLLGHTRDDQAETVLLGLTRGSGGRSLAGMRRHRGRYRRPLLDVGRVDTVTACQVEGLTFWTDPHNADPAYTRARLRRRVMPVLEDQLGPGVTVALARTADALREDTEFLDAVADQSFTTDAASLETLHPAIRRRVLRMAALNAGAPAAELFRDHVLAMDALVTDWHGQRWIDLPGHLRAVRRDGEIHVISATPPEGV